MINSDLRIEDILRNEGMYATVVTGVSMLPLIRNRRDVVALRPVQGRMSRFDVPLYRRGDTYVLHRVIEVLPDGYVICGDNCIDFERDITDENIVGVMEGFYRGEKWIDVQSRSYRLFVRCWCALFPMRRGWRLFRRVLRPRTRVRALAASLRASASK